MQVPLSKSKTKTMIAGIFPPKRKMLVAPGLFEPDVRGSAKPKSRATIIALAHDPTK